MCYKLVDDGGGDNHGDVVIDSDNVGDYGDGGNDDNGELVFKVVKKNHLHAHFGWV